MNNALPQRKRIRLPQRVYSQGHAFSVTCCTANREPWFAESTKLTEGCSLIAADLALERASQLYAWCWMPDHVHLLVQDRNLPEFIRLFKGRTVKLAREYRPEGPLWQRGYYDHTLRGEELLLDVARYIWANPVRAGLVNSPIEYAWSGSMVWPGWREEYRRG
ncbi:MAG: REP-associated tyrosine transposase [Thermodesulfobacteriota bacterium]